MQTRRQQWSFVTWMPKTLHAESYHLISWRHETKTSALVGSPLIRSCMMHAVQICRHFLIIDRLTHSECCPVRVDINRSAYLSCRDCLVTTLIIGEATRSVHKGQLLCSFLAAYDGTPQRVCREKS